MSNADELWSLYRNKIQARQSEKVKSELRPTTPPQHRSSSVPYHTSGPSTSSSIPPNLQSKGSNILGVRNLSSYLDLSKIEELSQKEIEYIWRLRHAPDPLSLCAVIPKSTYSRIEATARQHPQFILPLPREVQGAEIHFLQWTFPAPNMVTVLFTHLAEFKLRGEYSQPHTTITHHLDLAESKDLILLQGNIVDGRGITVDEAKWLLMCLQKFYSGDDITMERRKLLEQFSQGNGNFNIKELLEEAEKVV